MSHGTVARPKGLVRNFACEWAHPDHTVVLCRQVASAGGKTHSHQGMTDEHADGDQEQQRC